MKATTRIRNTNTRYRETVDYAVDILTVQLVLKNLFAETRWLLLADMFLLYRQGKSSSS
jgi:hypothetical protein